MAKSWREKLEGGKPAHIEILEKPFGGGKPGDKLLVATPRLVDAAIKALPMGAVMTVAELRSKIAQDHGADMACPISTSIFMRIASEVAIEDMEMGKPPGEVTPFWRAVEPASPLAKKLSCGPDFIARQREIEARRQTPAFTSQS